MAASAKSTAMSRLETENICERLLLQRLSIIQHFEHSPLPMPVELPHASLCEPLSNHGTLSADSKGSRGVVVKSISRPQSAMIILASTALQPFANATSGLTSSSTTSGSSTDNCESRSMQSAMVFVSAGGWPLNPCRILLPRI